MLHKSKQLDSKLPSEDEYLVYRSYLLVRRWREILVHIQKLKPQKRIHVV